MLDVELYFFNNLFYGIEVYIFSVTYYVFDWSGFVFSNIYQIKKLLLVLVKG